MGEAGPKTLPPDPIYPAPIGVSKSKKRYQAEAHLSKTLWEKKVQPPTKKLLQKKLSHLTWTPSSICPNFSL